MNEEIDIIELLKRVKEGKAPKEIEINNRIYKFNWNPPDICKTYIRSEDGYPFIWRTNDIIKLDTKIKILDKPIIEELKPVKYGNVVTIPDRDILMNKINEIIKFINNKGV